MIKIPDAGKWAEEAATGLRDAADKIATAPSPKYLGRERLRFDALKEEADAAIERLTAVEQIDRDRCIYVITLDDETDPAALMSAFRDRKQQKNLKLPQDNEHISRVLYVGSSCATKKRKRTLRSRLRQHLLKSPKGTYALSLAKWTKGLTGGVVVEAWQYPSLGQRAHGDASARDIVLAVEDWLAAKIKPVLGRRGSRN